jgi:hypothetical protein
MLADRFLARPKATRKILVNQEYRFTLLVFFFRESATSQDRNLHRLKIISSHN